MTEYDTWSKDELYELAQDMEIDGRSSMSKPELIKAITKAEGPDNPPSEPEQSDDSETSPPSPEVDPSPALLARQEREAARADLRAARLVHRSALSQSKQSGQVDRLNAALKQLAEAEKRYTEVTS